MFYEIFNIKPVEIQKTDILDRHKLVSNTIKLETNLQMAL